MFGPPEPADRLFYDALANEWLCERTTVRVGLHVEEMGCTHGIVYLQDESIGDKYEILVGKRLLKQARTHDGALDPDADEERILTHVKIMAISRWYAEQYNASVCRVPQTRLVKFLGMSAYVLVSRAQVPMLQVETFAADYRKFTYDRIPPDLSESLDRGEVDNSFLFSLYVFEQTGGDLLICNPTRVRSGVWGMPQIASAQRVGGYLDGGGKFMWEYMVSDSHTVMKKSYGLGGSRRDIFLRSLRLCLVQSKSGVELARRLDALKAEAARNNSVNVLTYLRPRTDDEEYDLRTTATAAREGPLRLNLVCDFPRNTSRANGAEDNDYLTQTTYTSQYGGVMYKTPAGHVWCSPDFTNPAPSPANTAEELAAAAAAAEKAAAEAAALKKAEEAAAAEAAAKQAAEEAAAADYAKLSEDEKVALGLKPFDTSSWRSRLQYLRGEEEDDGASMGAPLHLDSVNQVLEPLTFKVSLSQPQERLCICCAALHTRLELARRQSLIPPQLLWILTAKGSNFNSFPLASPSPRCR
jgi:hypothetical protein